MLYLYSGTDRRKSRDAMNAAITRFSKGAEVIHISDAHTMEDLSAALRGGGMFGGTRVVVLEELFAREEMREQVITSMSDMGISTDHFFIYEEKLDAATRKLLEKHAQKSERFDQPKKVEKASSIFAMGNALRSRNKKNLWISYQRELAVDTAPEAIHGVLFWAAKTQLLAARTDVETKHGKKLIAILAALPHESRRKGVELEYALERFVLSSDVVL